MNTPEMTSEDIAAITAAIEGAGGRVVRVERVEREPDTNDEGAS